jgi:hypothetical protein
MFYGDSSVGALGPRPDRSCGAVLFRIAHNADLLGDLRGGFGDVPIILCLRGLHEAATFQMIVECSDVADLAMADSILLGSIRLAAVQDKDRKARFMALMQETLAAALMDAAGLEMSWPEPPQAAPEHERSGSA